MKTPMGSTDMKKISGNPFSGLTIADMLLLAMCIVLLFQSSLQKVSPLFSYSDETAVLCLGLYSILHRIDQKRAPLKTGILVLSGIFVGIGLLGNLFSRVPDNIFPIAVDLFTCIKYPLVIVFGCDVLKSKRKLTDCLVVIGKALLLVMAAAFFASQIIDMGMTGDIRMGMASFCFVFPHQTFLVWFSASLLFMFIATEQSVFWIGLDLFLMATTLRAKALGFIVVTVVLLLANRRGKGALLTAAVIASVLAVGVSARQLAYYYSSDGFARTEMTRACMRIAEDYYPFGSGFATFGSNITSTEDYYSVLYERYGLSEIWGLTRGHASFVSDTFWPTVVGQFGWVGLICYVLLIIVANIYLFKNATNRRRTLLVLLGFAFFIISSTSESAFFNPSAVILTMGEILGLTYVGSTAGPSDLS